MSRQASILKFCPGGVAVLKRLSEERSEEGRLIKKRAQGQEYEKKNRDRKFRDDWAKDRLWLQFTDKDTMQCTLCMKYPDLSNKSSNFTTAEGCHTLSSQTVQRHEDSRAHKRCAARDEAIKAKPGIFPII